MNCRSFMYKEGGKMKESVKEKLIQRVKNEMDGFESSIDNIKIQF